MPDADGSKLDCSTDADWLNNAAPFTSVGVSFPGAYFSAKYLAMARLSYSVKPSSSTWHGASVSQLKALRDRTLGLTM